MEKPKVSIRDLRLKFPEIRQKIARHGGVVITDNGVPSYLLEPVQQKIQGEPPPVDYWARLSKQRSKPLSAEQTAELHKENRGDR